MVLGRRGGGRATWSLRMGWWRGGRHGGLRGKKGSELFEERKRGKEKKKKKR
jgi:hypothetical protein